MDRRCGCGVRRSQHCDHSGYPATRIVDEPEPPFSAAVRLVPIAASAVQIKLLCATPISDCGARASGPVGSGSCFCAEEVRCRDQARVFPGYTSLDHMQVILQTAP